MREKKDPLEKLIAESYEEIAREELEKIEKDDSIQMPPGVKESVWAKIDEKIKAMDEEAAWNNLSKEDREALELGRKLQQESEAGSKQGNTSEIRTLKKRRSKRMYLVIAAALVLTLAIGVTSIGGPERIVLMVKQAIIRREVEKINSSKENLIIEEENEEEAYEKISEEFGVEPVKVIYTGRELAFDEMVFDKTLQIAELLYKCEDKNLVYYINASYAASSWGVDVEDEVIKTETKNINGCDMEIKEYRVASTEERRYSAKFQYQGLEYILIGTVDGAEFEKILENLFFVH